MPPPMQNTPGITIPQFSAEPLATEGEATPGPDDENPFENARELREQIDLEQRRRAHDPNKLTRTVPQPQDPELPPALLEEDTQEATDPFGLPTLQPDVSVRFDTGDLFRF